MKKGLKILLLVLLLLALVIGGILYTQRENLKALSLALSYSSQDLTEQMREKDAQFKEEMKPYLPEDLREYTQEEQEQIESGEMTEKQVLAKIINEAMEKRRAELDEKAKQPETTKQKEEAIVSLNVSKLYALEGKYIGMLEGLAASAVADYQAQRAASGASDSVLRLSVASSYIGQASALEGACDGEVNAILADMEKELKAVGGDLSVLSKIRSAYADEKALKRAYYMSRFSGN